MKYAEALKIINSPSALKSLKIEFTEQGSYLNFSCPCCKEQAVIKAHGEKKNLWYCPKCKLSGHVISLAMDILKLEYQPAKEYLLDKATKPDKPIDKELYLNLELEWCDFMEKELLNKENCEVLGIGRPKGKTVLAGHLAFTIWNEEHKKIAYVGYRLSDGKRWFPKNFNPELYLYNLCHVNPDDELVVVPDMIACARFLSQGHQAVSTFWLNYLSLHHLALLQPFKYLILSGFGENIGNIAYMLADLRLGFHRFI